MGRVRDLWIAYKLRLRRRRFLARAARKRMQMRYVQNRTDQIKPNDILCFGCARNEVVRLPYFLEYHRKLGVDHFLIVDNQSDDGTTEFLQKQPDVSLWTASGSYKKSRFGLDWVTSLMFRFGHGHWCLTLDADELFAFPHSETRSLRELTSWLDQNRHHAVGALMLDLYPKGRLSEHIYQSGQDPTEILSWYDANNYRMQVQQPYGSHWIQGGVRDRVFFGSEPERAPTLNKVPLVKWHRRYAYVTSTHQILPKHLNQVFGFDGLPTAVLLHTKFLNLTVGRAAEEKLRQEHFANSALYDAYYDGLMADPDFWNVSSVHYEGTKGLMDMGLMTAGGWVEE